MAESKYPATNIFISTGNSLISVLRGLDKAGDGAGNVILESEFDIKEVPFGFASGSPMSVAAVVAGERVKKVAIEITVPFNDPTARLSIGHTGNPQALMAEDDNIPTEIALFETSPSFKYGGDDTIKLYITRAGATQGSGIVYVETERNDV